jgi:hypothetical protein
MIMSNRFKKAIIINDTTGSDIDARLQENLFDLFKSTMKSLAVTLVREATFDTSDFATAKRRGCEGFELHMKRLNDTLDAWSGVFRRGNEKLEVRGHME